MKRMFLKLATMSLCFLLTGGQLLISAQNGPGNGGEILTNEKVITMTKAGLPASIIVNKIRGSQTNFDTSTEELVRLKNARVADDVVNAMLEASTAKNGRESSFPGTTHPATSLAASGYPNEIGVYLKRGEQWVEVLPEVVNWKTGGVLKSVASLGVVKGDVNGHIDGNQSRTRVTTQLQFLIVAPEGVAITEYQLLKLNQHKDNREFRTITGGVLHTKGGSTRDLVSFEGQKVASRTFVVALTGLNVGEYGFLPPGSSSSAPGAVGLSKMYTFSLTTQQ